MSAETFVPRAATGARLSLSVIAAAVAVGGSFVVLPASAADGQIRITEWEYNGSEFVELTNIGDAPVDMSGWSYDDDSRTPGGFDLSGFGQVAAGRSVVFSEASAADFRAEWGLGADVMVLGDNSVNLGRADEINIYDAAGTLVDRLTYGDQDFPGSIRTDTASGWVPAAALGANDVTQWVRSTVGDAEGSWLSASGFVGSPGVSTLGTPSEDGDEVTQNVRVTVPEAAPGEFVWTIDGSNDLVDLGTAEAAGDHYAATGSINPVRVTDTRAGKAAWSLSAQVGDFTSGDRSFTGAYLGWTPGVTQAGGGAQAGAPVASGFDGGDGLSVPATLGQAQDGHELGSAVLGAELDLKVPVDVADGTYSATLTLTALA